MSACQSTERAGYIGGSRPPETGVSCWVKERPGNVQGADGTRFRYDPGLSKGHRAYEQGVQ